MDLNQGQTLTDPAFEVTKTEEERPEAKYNTAFKQQNLKHFRLNVSPGGFATVAIVIGIFFIPIGFVLLYSSGQAQETAIDYTHCHKTRSNCPSFKKPGKFNCCMIDFTLKEDFTGKVYIYYELTNFHQNHRLFVKSRDDRQLYGGTQSPSKDCKPFAIDKNSSKQYWPCGALANAMFQDRFKIFSVSRGTRWEIQIDRTGISWPSDLSFKFRNPQGWNTSAFQQKHAPPPSWRRLPWDLDNGVESEEFVVWMRASAFPEFRKQYGTISNESTMYKGNYSLEIEDGFEVRSFKGTKSVVIATKGVLGGKNSVLGILYLFTGSTFLVTGLIFLVIHLNLPTV